MRGASQRKNIPNNHIYKLLQIIDNVSTLTITGGEPTLNMEALEQIRTCIIYGNADVNNFYMVTNGKSINIDSIAELAYKMTLCCSDNEMSQICFSFDSYHQYELNDKQIDKKQRNYYDLKEKMEYEYGIVDNGGEGIVSKHSDKSWDHRDWIAEGRAKDFGAKDNDINIFEIDKYGEEHININETTLYLSCSGYIVAGCNWSYNTIDKNKDIRIAHIDEINSTDDLINAIKKYNKTAEKQLQCV